MTSTVQPSRKNSGLLGRTASAALSSAVLLRLGSARKKGKTKTGLLASVLLTVMIFTIACGGGSSSVSGGTGGGVGGGGGGSADCSSGTSIPSGGTFTFEVLHDFSGGLSGGLPLEGVVADAAGNLYGTLTIGGNLASGQGIAYKMDPAGNEMVLTDFSTDPGGAGGTNLILDAAGNLYGTSSWGGVGQVFEIDPAGNVTDLYNFTGGADGRGPLPGMVRDAAGNIYGITTGGGDLTNPNCPPFYCGVVFKLDANGQETVLHDFEGGTDGETPYGQKGNLVVDPAGNLYGFMENGGASNTGFVFKIDPNGTYTVLHSFGGPNDGLIPQGGLVQDAACNLYGATEYGGASNAGTVFKLDPAGNETVLYSFTGGADGYGTGYGLALDGAGNLYGASGSQGGFGGGVVFKLDPSGNETVLHTFVGTDGAYPQGVSLDSEGNLYGTTGGGGIPQCGTPSFYCGVVFKLTRSP
jgi:uncharacterized repeat protein (TIGR03803 family)